jgi:nitroreductase
VETWDAITSRRDVRDFTDRPIAGDDLDRILEAGRRAPSSRNGQPWDFLVVTDRDQLATLAQVWRCTPATTSSSRANPRASGVTGQLVPVDAGIP